MMIPEWLLGLRLWAYRHLARRRAQRTIRALTQRPAPPPIVFDEYWMPPYFAAHGTPVERGVRVLGGRRPTDADWELLNGRNGIREREDHAD